MIRKGEERAWIGLFALCLTLISALACTGDRSKSHDRSLPGPEYAALGIPDASAEWGPAEYAACMKILSSLPRQQLPRYGSAKSGNLFDRMLQTHLALGDQVLVSSSEAFEANTPLLPQLYDSPDANERASFARERIAIRSAILRTMLRTSPTIQQLEEKVRKLQLALESTPPAHKSLVRTDLEGTQQLSKMVGKAVADLLIDLASIGRDKGVSKDALRELARTLSALVPEARAYISGDDRQRVRSAIQATASQIGDAEIADDLSRTASSL